MDAKINGFTVYILKSNRFYHTSAILNRLNLNTNNKKNIFYLLYRIHATNYFINQLKLFRIHSKVINALYLKTNQFND